VAGHRVLRAGEAHWRPSHAMKVMNCDLAGQLGASSLTARYWRLAPGQANTRHRHRGEAELYVLLEGTGRIRVEGELLTLAPMDAVVVAPDALRQVFNDTEREQLWLIVGAPPDQLSAEDSGWVYPDGRQALPPELSPPG
jgi:quercetin dioxygenase-like cupin family protein